MSLHSNPNLHFLRFQFYESPGIREKITTKKKKNSQPTTFSLIKKNKSWCQWFLPENKNYMGMVGNSNVFKKLDGV
jgi:hypothetical protein